MLAQLLLLLSVFIGMVELPVLDLVTARINSCLVLLHGQRFRTEASINSRVKCSTEGLASALSGRELASIIRTTPY